MDVSTRWWGRRQPSMENNKWVQQNMSTQSLVFIDIFRILVSQMDSKIPYAPNLGEVKLRELFANEKPDMHASISIGGETPSDENDHIKPSISFDANPIAQEEDDSMVRLSTFVQISQLPKVYRMLFQSPMILKS